MAKRKPPELIRGNATHRRTETDYMGALLETVTLADWRDVVAGALQGAKAGDAQARNWLAQYLVGRPEGKAPTPLTVVVQQLNGADPVVNRLAKPLIDREKYPSMHRDDHREADIRALLSRELLEKIRPLELPSNPIAARAGGDFSPQ